MGGTESLIGKLEEAGVSRVCVHESNEERLHLS